MLTTDAIELYYTHPWAWDEIGFGGPAYPRAYTRLERGEPEPWEIEEQRYEWVAFIERRIGQGQRQHGRRRRTEPSRKRRDALKMPILGAFKAPKDDNHMVVRCRRFTRRYAALAKRK